MTGDELYTLAENVVSRHDFLTFVRYLQENLQQTKDEWQNSTLLQYLGALGAFTSDMDGYYKNMGEAVDVEQITWRLAAQMLLAASVYEG